MVGFIALKHGKGYAGGTVDTDMVFRQVLSKGAEQRASPLPF